MQRTSYQTSKQVVAKAVAYINVFGGVFLDTLAERIDPAAYNIAYERAEDTYTSLHYKTGKVIDHAQSALRQLRTGRGDREGGEDFDPEGGDSGAGEAFLRRD